MIRQFDPWIGDAEWRATRDLYEQDYLDRFRAVCLLYEAAGGKIEKVPRRDGVTPPAVVRAPEQLTLF